jgi:hypothetical protein
MEMQKIRSYFEANWEMCNKMQRMFRLQHPGTFGPGIRLRRNKMDMMEKFTKLEKRVSVLEKAINITGR